MGEREAALVRAQEEKQCQDRERSLAVTEGMWSQQSRDYIHAWWEMDLAKLEKENREHERGYRICLLLIR